MDTSEQYIKMCDCPEIQEQRPLDSWERYKDGDILFAHWPDGTSYPVERRKRRIGVYTVCGNNPDKYSKAIWLPRQDQLQEMVREKGMTWKGRLIYRFYNWLESLVVHGEEIYKNYFSNSNLNYESMEQLWLAFVMKTLHSKTWDGERWKKQGEV